MQSVDTLIHARWIIPVEPDNTVLENHTVALRDGKILAILPTPEANGLYRSDDETHLREHALMPGLINAHTHASMTLLRGIADDLPLMDWLQNHIWPAEAKWVSDRFVYDGTQIAIAESIRSGVTCFNEMYFFPDQAAKAAADAHFRATIGLIIIDFPTVWAANTDEYIDKALAVHDRYRQHPLISTAFAPHAPYTVSDGPLSRVNALANELDIPIHIHVHETAFEVESASAQSGKRPLQRLRELGIVNSRLLAVHMTQLTDAEITLCAEQGVHVLHCPESNMKLASGFCPVAKLMNAGVNVALGTDGAASNNDLDMIGEMRSAALLAKVVAGDASALPAHAALRMATINGAKALGLDAHIGSVKVGKYADLAAVDLGSLDTQPIYHPISQLVYSTTRRDVSDVWIAGKQVMKSSVLTTLDEADLKSKAAQWGEKIRQKA